jgi:ABC-type nitrate/sulfonate/bicarbonate transport system permease component
MNSDARALTSDHALEVERRFALELRTQRRMHILARLALNVTGLAVFLALWEIAPRLIPGTNTMLFPPPSAVAEAAWPMVTSGELIENIGVSLARAFVGFVLASILAVLIGIATARLRVIRDLSEPLLHAFRSIPVIALVPLSVLWFGIGETSKIALIVCGAFFPVWISTSIGVRDVPIAYLRSAACLGAGSLQTMFLVVLPAALPMILAGLRQAIAISLIVLVAAELSGATLGVAHMMSLGYQLFKVDVMFIGLFILGALGFILDRLFVSAMKRLFPWYTTAN